MPQASAFRLLLASLVLVPLGILVISSWLAWVQVWHNAETELARTTDAAAEYAARLLDGHALLADWTDERLRGLSDEQIREHEATLHAVLHQIVVTRPSVLTLYAIDAGGGAAGQCECVPRAARGR
jgi:hypothetical protein